MEQALLELLKTANGFMWGPPMLILLFGTHVYLTFRLKFIQKYIFKAIKLSVTSDKNSQGDVSQFAALSTALAATIGTGNIVGVATAVAMGGPGAVLWMWLTGVFGIATKYAEGLLAVKYRVRTSDGTMLGGPMYALEKGVKAKWLAVLFCIFTSIAAFGIGCSTQANAVAGLMRSEFSISPLVTGIIMAIAVFIVIIGGIKSIANVCEKLVPFMACFYVLGCSVILIFNASYIGEAISLILVSAFTPQAAGGGFVGSTIMLAARFGVARGLFSNESGLGSAPIAAAAAQTRNPVRQALVSMSGTFWDTVIICLLTGLVLVTSIIKSPAMFTGLKGGDLTSAAFGQIDIIGPAVLVFGLATFAFSTILGWAYYGERAMEYLFGKKALLPYRLLFVIVTFLGSITAIDVVWEFADLMNALMAVPNLVSLLLLSGVIINETKKYLWEDNLEATSEDEIEQL
ncbi:MAG: sodium:alanine symporter family protein [Sporomusaceae bacterium]|jgi:AGCS family alanine or glycine:cation symporter|nr:sodium:alanine symporter family protein [Sporomusaceae bacterium]